MTMTTNRVRLSDVPMSSVRVSPETPQGEFRARVIEAPRYSYAEAQSGGQIITLTIPSEITEVLGDDADEGLIGRRIWPEAKWFIGFEGSKGDPRAPLKRAALALGLEGFEALEPAFSPNPTNDYDGGIVDGLIGTVYGVGVSIKDGKPDALGEPRKNTYYNFRRPS